ncbi:hypothetical protein [Paractinoplanes durhamensis]|uniref:Uncharacterized protein n=1 Tax=Paractinoplanes durhamensis TaxID=113563 RepID=A0ABQ3ZBE0_9ACTN|nr:hypothetical protein [Actinoplanes durhamensis]GIE07132.1 hypothetical protein Adu01nite_84820 [Actinoplanes durhamensis]
MVERVEENSATSHTSHPSVTARPLGRLEADRRRWLTQRHETRSRLSQVAVATFNSTL